MDYTIMGNAVNLAARLEGVNKQYRTGGILISEYTMAQCGDEFACRKLDRVRVVGVNTPLRLYELLGLKAEMDEMMRLHLEVWDKAIDAYEKWKFSEAADFFNTLRTQFPGDRVVELYASRCNEYISDPPDPGWDGVYNLTEK